MPQRVCHSAHAFGQVPLSPWILVTVIVVTGLVSSASAVFSRQAGWLAADYPNPGSEPAQHCGFHTDINANGTVWLCDPDRVLSLNEALLLAEYLKSLVHASPCDCQAVECPSADTRPTGYIIGLALVDRLNIEGMTFEPINVKAANFAKTTREKWFADLGCHDNALVFYARFSNELYISIGEKTEEVVSDLELAGLYQLGEEHFPSDDGSNSGQEEEESALDVSRTAAPGHTELYTGLRAVVSQLDRAIADGPSLSSRVIFAFAIPVLLLVVLTLMCLISNLWCAQDISLPEPSPSSRTSSSRRDPTPQPEADR